MLYLQTAVAWESIHQPPDWETTHPSSRITAIPSGPSAPERENLKFYSDLFKITMYLNHIEMFNNFPTLHFYIKKQKLKNPNRLP